MCHTRLRDELMTPSSLDYGYVPQVESLAKALEIRLI